MAQTRPFVSVDPITYALPDLVKDALLPDIQSELLQDVVTSVIFEGGELYFNTPRSMYNFGGTTAAPYIAMSSGGSSNFPYTANLMIDMSLTGSRTFTFGTPDYQYDNNKYCPVIVIRFSNLSTTPRTVTFNGNVVFAGGVKPVMPTAQGGNMVVRFTAFGTNWLGELLGYNFA